MAQKHSVDFSKYENLSPFEVAPELIKLASSTPNRPVLNAGRGNPDFLATTPRAGYWQLGRFALEQSELSFSYLSDGLGGPAPATDIADRFVAFLERNKGQEGIHFLKRAVSYVRDQMGLDANAFLKEACDAVLGCYYPVPPRSLSFSEKIIGRYVMTAVGGDPHDETTDFFPIEGGTAAMTYVFNSLKQNNILKAGDTVALGLPTFSPYIEIPQLSEYGYKVTSLHADPKKGWQYPESELEKLLDPSIKVFFLVNPSNPPAVKLDDKSLQKLEEIVKKRPDLIILTDDVYGTFADDFKSIYVACPKNTILVYSFSKYFGATGWRLGTIGMAKENVLDEMLRKQDTSTKKMLAERYSSLTADTADLKFIDRLVADSRAVALNHTAGLSTPQQYMMVMFSLFDLMDLNRDYQKMVKELLRRREEVLYRAVGIDLPNNPGTTDYYTLFELQDVATALHGADFGSWIVKEHGGQEIFFRLADEEGIVLMPGKGFGDIAPSARASLANLRECDYAAIGKGFRALLDRYYDEFKSGKK